MLYLRGLALASALLCSFPSYGMTDDGIPAWRDPAVVRVNCDEGSGTAFRVGPSTMLSVAHVTSLHNCTILGKPFTVVQRAGDFSVISVPDTSNNWFHIDCHGFVFGQRYEAVGFARGLDTLTIVDLTANGQIARGMARLVGVFTVIPGQSGGPVIDKLSGNVVGTVNVYNAEVGDSGSIPLQDTPVCRA